MAINTSMSKIRFCGGTRSLLPAPGKPIELAETIVVTLAAGQQPTPAGRYLCGGSLRPGGLKRGFPPCGAARMQDIDQLTERGSVVS
jgi:hypothetical protein